ncbi:MAG TPA: hypothetical protein GX404_06795 [Syntrophomonadaceae bacterium]|nr:hypothetical protein [Syntrophomonadaceae bacterium]
MHMLDKMITMGFGAMALTRERAEKLMDEMVERGEISKEEAKKSMDDLLQKGEEQKSEIRSMIREEMDKWRNEFGVVNKTELESLEARIKDLESKIQQ